MGKQKRRAGGTEGQVGIWSVVQERKDWSVDYGNRWYSSSVTSHPPAPSVGLGTTNAKILKFKASRQHFLGCYPAWLFSGLLAPHSPILCH